MVLVTSSLPVVQVKGLFNESLPNFLKEQAIYASSDEVVSYLHIDCDLYGGARCGRHHDAPCVMREMY